jgi:hypothetical protein
MRLFKTPRFATARVRKAPTPTRVRPRLEALEDRAVPAVLTVSSVGDNAADPTTLRGAIAAAAAGDTINFAPGLAGQTITLTAANGPLDLTKNVTIQGPGGGQVLLSGNNATQVLKVEANVTATINNVTVENGLAANDIGGGIKNLGNLTLNNDEVKNNKTTFSTALLGVTGGGIVNGAGASLVLNDCTVDGNTADGTTVASSGEGGGLANTGTATITNSTFFNNQILGGGANAVADGGGLWNEGTLTLINATVNGNTATATGAGSTNEGGGIFNQDGGGVSLNLLNTIVANNTLGAATTATGPDVFGTLSKAQASLFGTATTGNGYTIATDLGRNVVGNPLLGPLQNNGGPTPTEAIPANSPAAFSGVASSTLGTVPTTDQRGAPRFAATTGMGAFQPAVPTPTPVPTSVSLTVAEHYTLFSQQETVTAQVSASNGKPVAGGTVTITDAGQTQTVSINSSGSATATFTFPLSQEQPSPHTISAAFTSATPTTFANSSGSTQAPNTTSDWFFQLLIDYAILVALGL